MIAISTEMFFDAEAVMKALSDAERKTLSQFGAYVRQRAKSLIKPAIVENKRDVKRLGAEKRYVPSQPGEPPRSRQGDLRALIFFGYDQAAHSVVIGPMLRGGVASETPARLEFGGEFRAKSGKIIRVKKRPYMKPAFDTEMARMPQLFKDTL